MDIQTDTGLAADWRTSENYQPRRDGRRPDILLMHYTGMETAEWAIRRLCDVDAGVSCHYLVDETGKITQMVREEFRAWHAGKSFWHGETDINSSSVGIEIANIGHDRSGKPATFPDSQMQAVIALSRDIVRRWEIPAHRVIGHSDVAPRRKRDPGEAFSWQQLHGAGIGHWVEPDPVGDDRGLGPGSEGEGVKRVQSLLRDYGYNQGVTGVYSKTTADVVSAFQRHFRQDRVDGIADLSTIGTLEKLHAALATV